MSIKLRYRENRDGSETPYLDIYEKGQKRKREFMSNLKLVSPKNSRDREHNRQVKILAEQALSKRVIAVQSEIYDLVPAEKRNLDVVAYFGQYVDRYNKKDKRVISASLAKFEAFLKEERFGQLKMKMLTKALVIDFKAYLEENLKGETPSNYFKKFKKVLESLVDKGYLSQNPAKGIKLNKGETVNKDILSFEEIRTLYNTEITNKEVKNAFIFSCYTGLRFCDIKELKHTDIQAGRLKLIQKKTGKPVVLNLHSVALEILSQYNSRVGTLFDLPSHTACLKDLKVWVKRAGISKHISWHCARHSFATGIIEHGADISSASALLGHSSYTYTQRYVRIVEKLKDTAISNLP